MAGRMAREHHRDPSDLTPQEARIWELASQGMGPRAISQTLGSPSPNNVSQKLTIIREKIACRGSGCRERAKI